MCLLAGVMLWSALSGATPASPKTLDPANLELVDVPALTPPPGARRLIGLNVSNAVASLSPAGDVLALADTLGVQLIHIPTGRGLAVRRDFACAEPDSSTHSRCTFRLAFSSDGERLAVFRPLDSRLAVLAVPSGKTVFETHLERVHALEFLDDGRLIALGDVTLEERDQKAVLYAYDAAGARSELFKGNGYVNQISEDGRQIVIHGDKNQIVDVATGKVVTTPPGNIAIDKVGWGLDGSSWVASTLIDEWPDVVTWRAGDRAVRTLATSSAARAKPDGAGLWGFAFPRPFDQVFVGKDAGLVGVGLDGAPRFRSAWLTAAQLEPHGIARVGDRLVVLDHGCPLRLDARGQLETGPLLCALRPGQLAFDKDRIVSIPWRRDIVMTLDASTGALVASRPRGHLIPATPDTLAAVARDPQLAARVEKALRDVNIKHDLYQLSRDGRTLFARGTNDPYTAAIIDLESGRSRLHLRELVASPDGSRIVQHPADGSEAIEVRTVQGDRLVRSMTFPDTTPVSRAVLSENGRQLVAETKLKLAVIDVDSGRTTFKAPCHTSYAEHIVLSRDGRLLVCAKIGGDVEVYDLRAKKLIKRIKLYETEAVDTFALSDDGRHLAIGSETIAIVDL
jgi:WD40 repeat protein